MASLEIAPNGEIDFGFATIDGEAFVCIDMTDAGGIDTVRLYFRRGHFVTFADHLKMIADSEVRDALDDQSG